MNSKSVNVIYHNATVTLKRRNQLNKHSGKFTLAHTIEEELYKMGCRTYVRHGLSSN